MIGLEPALSRALRLVTDAGTAELAAHGLLGQLWDVRRGGPRWEAVSRAWEGALAGGDPRLSAELDPADRVRLLTGNAAAMEARLQLVAGAKRTIDLSTYYVQNDATGRAAVAALVAAARRGVRVRAVADAFITRKKEHDTPGALALWRELEAAGAETRLWRDPRRPFDSNHRKLLLVDEEALLLGGRNLADHYAGPLWRDVELLLTGPSARAAAPLFERTLRGEPEPPPRPGGLLHGTAPEAIARHAGFLQLLHALGAARATVEIENAYYFGHPAILRALAAARARGVRVRVLSNSAESNDLGFANHRLYLGLRATLAAGAEVFVRTGAGRTLHCKYWLVDGELCSLGSGNLDYYSPRHCLDCFLHARSRALGALLSAWFEEGLAGARPFAEVDAPAPLASRAADLLLRDQQ